MTDRDVRPFLEAADRGLNWIVEQQNRDGSFCRPEDGIGGYYKVADPDRFYYRMDIEGNLLTDVPDGQELFYYVDATRCEQIYYNPGIALIFLAHLYLATGETRYLDAGKTLFDFTQRCAADVYRFPPSGKLGYGTALLYALTGDPQARRTARDVGAYLTETQTGEGFWRLPDVAVYQAIEEKDDFEIRLDITAEFSIFLMEIAALI
ncbi:MAG: hypothetical protein ACC628_19490 [Pirellulaceae bacterium]